MTRRADRFSQRIVPSRSSAKMGRGSRATASAMSPNPSKPPDAVAAMHRWLRSAAGITSSAGCLGSLVDAEFQLPAGNVLDQAEAQLLIGREDFVAVAPRLEGDGTALNAGDRATYEPRIAVRCA